MKKFVIRFFGSGVRPEYTGFVASIDIVVSIEIMAQDKYCAIEIAKRMLSNNILYYTDKYDVVEVEKAEDASNGNDSLLW